MTQPPKKKGCGWLTYPIPEHHGPRAAVTSSANQIQGRSKRARAWRIKLPRSEVSFGRARRTKILNFLGYEIPPLSMIKVRKLPSITWIVELTKALESSTWAGSKLAIGRSSNHLPNQRFTERPSPICHLIPCNRNPAMPLIFFQIQDPKVLERIDLENPFFKYLNLNHEAHRDADEQPSIPFWWDMQSWFHGYGRRSRPPSSLGRRTLS